MKRSSYSIDLRDGSALAEERAGKLHLTTRKGAGSQTLLDCIVFSSLSSYTKEMQISAIEEYGLRCALQLARLESGKVLSASQIAEREGISVQYASKILHLLKKAGIVKATRGIQGGFSLASAPNELYLKPIFHALKEEEQLRGDFCGSYSGLKSICVHHQDCSVRPVWSLLASYFDAVLEKIHLGDLVQKESSVGKVVVQVASKEAEKVHRRISGKVEAYEAK